MGRRKHSFDLTSKLSFYFIVTIVPFITRTVSGNHTTVSSTQQLVQTIESDFNKNETFEINSAVMHAFVYKINSSSVDIMTANFQIKTSVEARFPTSQELRCPLVFTLRQKRSSKSWILPNTVIYQSNKGGDADNLKNSLTTELKHSHEFTLCLESDTSGDNNQTDQEIDEESDDLIEFVISVSTCSRENVPYSIFFSFQTSGFLLELDNPVENITVLPSIARFYRFNFPPEIQRVILHVDSSDHICMTAAVQSPWCKSIHLNWKITDDSAPVAEALDFKRIWQDMHKKAHIIVEKSDYPSGFFLFLVVHDNDAECKSKYNEASISSDWLPLQHKHFYSVFPNAIDSDEGANATGTGTGTGTGSSVNEEDGHRAKNVNIEINEIPEISYILPMMIPLLCILLIILVTFLIYFMNDKRIYPFVDSGEIKIQPGGSSNNTDTFAEVELFEENIDDEDDLEWLAMTVFIRKKEINEHRENSARPNKSFLNIILNIAGILYLVPNDPVDFVWQQIKQIVLPADGDDNLCYRNYLCSHKWWIFHDVNHMYPNIAYILYGLTFLFFARHYQTKYRKQGQASEEDMDGTSSFGNFDDVELKGQGSLTFEKNVGVFKHYEVFYILGVSLILEGILSIVYHICPTQDNFPFDSSFLTIVALLGIIKIYQFRHSDFPFSQEYTFEQLSWILFLFSGGITLSIFLDQTYFPILNWIFVSLQMGVVVPMVSVYMFKIGHVKYEDSPDRIVTSFGLFLELLPPYLKSKYWTVQFLLWFPGVAYIVMKYSYEIIRYAVTFLKSYWSSSSSCSLGRNPWTRLGFVIPFCFTNALIAIFQLVFVERNDFNRHLVLTVVFNACFYFWYYCLMKFWHKEFRTKQSIQPIIYCAFSAILGISVAICLSYKPFDPTWSPADSRLFNKPCMNASFGEFYDVHDLMHFLLSGFIFFFLMTLLTLDDGIRTKPRYLVIAF